MTTSASPASQEMTQENAQDFDLDVTLLEIADPGSLVNVTDDNCGSTCGACTTGVA
jgi:FxLD family lantipeptide